MARRMAGLGKLRHFLFPSARLSRKLHAVEKKLRALVDQLRSNKALAHLDESERILYARSLAATPDERWRMSQEFLRSHGLSKLSERKEFGFK